MKKSTTQMTKMELLDVIKQKENLIAELNVRIDDLEAVAISSMATPMDRDSSDMLSSLRTRIAELESLLAEK